MITAGAVAQVRALLDQGVTDQAPVMRALGARELAAHALGASPLDGAVEAAKAATRHFAKRQTTWFRNQFHASCEQTTQFYERLLQGIFNNIDRFLLTTPQGGD